MTRVLALLLALAAPAAQACAVAEGCPMGEPPAPVGGCAVVRIDAGHVCIDDPTAPGGARIEPRGGLSPAQMGHRVGGGLGVLVLLLLGLT